MFGMEYNGIKKSLWKMRLKRFSIDILIWFSCVLWHIKPFGLLNAKILIYLICRFLSE